VPAILRQPALRVEDGGPESGVRLWRTRLSGRPRCRTGHRCL